MNIVGPFNHTNYNFITENSIDISDAWIQYAEENINRSEKQLELSNLLNNIDIALKIELSILEFTLIYCQNNKFDKRYIVSVYLDTFNNIILNLKKVDSINNISLKNNLLDGKINPNHLAFLSPSQIHPDKWDYYIKKKEYIEQRENNISYSDAYKCYKCGESKSKVVQVQTRCADEPMTTFVTCLVCHNTFKFC
jgi:DNA-directed RNA polymerase subunit M/transcription elongation factor TFIIS